MAIVTRLEPERYRSRRWVVGLDGETWRLAPKAVVAKLGLELEDEVDPEQLAEQIDRVEYAAARERALYLISSRERSTAEVERKLAEDGYLSVVADSIVAELVRSGLIDDSRFAESLVRTLGSGRGYGRGRLARELGRRGVGSEESAETLEALCPADEEPGRALEQARRMLRSHPALDTQRLAARLARRGYAPGVALGAARAAVGADDDGLEA